MLKPLFDRFASYNRWANARLYEAAAALPDERYRQSVGVFFGSLHGTLNHLLVTDRIWLWRLTGEGPPPQPLDTILHDELPALWHARRAEDARLLDFVAPLSEEDLAATTRYQTSNGSAHEQPVAEILQHLFNHQAHHRGQAHACLSILSGHAPPSLDLIAFLRGGGVPSESGNPAVT